MCLKWLKAAILALGLFLAGSVRLAAAESVVLHFGSVAMDIPAVMHKRLQPLTGYLSESLGVPVVLKLSSDMPAAIAEVVETNVDIAYLTPVAYIRAHREGDAELLVKTVTGGKGAFRLMVVVGEDSPLARVEDLAGKRFAFGDKAALLQRAVVVGAGVRLEDLGEYNFIGHYDNIARGVMNGDFDAGILKDTMAYQWEGKGIKVIYASPELPPYNIVVSRNVDPDLKEKIRQAFLSLDVRNPAHRRIIEALDPRYDGFMPVADEEYDIVRTLVKPFL